MNVTPWILRVKRRRADLGIALCVSATVTLCLLVLEGLSDDSASRAQQLSSGLAAGLARLAVEPVVERDRIGLGVLASRLVELEEIEGITVHTVGNEMLAISGEVLRGEPAIEPVVQDSAVIGWVRVYPAPAAPQGNSRGALIALIACMVPLVVVGLAQLPWSRLGQRSASTAPPTDAATTSDAAARLPRYLMVLNLFNQLSLKPESRMLELEHARSLAEAVGRLYGGTVTPLPGTGLLMDFGDTEDPDRAFQITCGTLLLAVAIADSESLGQYRFGLHCASWPAAVEAELDSDEVADAALLSAIAKNQTVAISEALFQTISRPERLSAEPMQNPLLSELTSTPPEAWLVSGLTGAQAALIRQQARELLEQAGYDLDSTSNESAF